MNPISITDEFSFKYMQLKLRRECEWIYIFYHCTRKIIKSLSPDGRDFVVVVVYFVVMGIKP